MLVHLWLKPKSKTYYGMTPRTIHTEGIFLPLETIFTLHGHVLPGPYGNTKMTDVERKAERTGTLG